MLPINYLLNCNALSYTQSVNWLYYLCYFLISLQKNKTMQPCAMCRSSHLMSEMLENQFSEDLVELFCNYSCVMAAKIQAVNTAGTALKLWQHSCSLSLYFSFSTCLLIIALNEIGMSMKIKCNAVDWSKSSKCK